MKIFLKEIVSRKGWIGNPRTLLLGITIGATIRQNRIKCPPNTTGRDTMLSNQSIPEYTSWKQQKLSLKVNEALDVYSSSIDNRQNKEAILIPYPQNNRYRRGLTNTKNRTHEMQWYSARKKTEILPFSGTWMNLAYNSLSDRGPNKNNKYCIIPWTREC